MSELVATRQLQLAVLGSSSTFVLSSLSDDPWCARAIAAGAAASGSDPSAWAAADLVEAQGEPARPTRFVTRMIVDVWSADLLDHCSL